MKIVVQANEYTRKIRRDMRFVFSHSEFDIFRVLDITASTYNGIITIIAIKDTMRVEDDLENNLAFNEPRIYTPPQEVKDYTIVGEESVRVGRSYKYSLEPAENLRFAIDDTDVAEIMEIQNNTCTVLIKAKDEIFNLSVTDQENSVKANKVIYTTK